MGLLSFFLSVPVESNAQRTEVLAPLIETIQVLKNAEFDSSPVIELNSDEYLEISFDQLSHEYHRYYYEIEHCDAAYKPSNISQFDFMDGFSTNYIDDYATSINTTVPYTNYRFELPNDNVSLKLSGNYRISVFDDDNNEKPVFRAYFSIVEPKVKIDASVSANTLIDNNKGHQQVSFTINHKGVQLRNPQQNVKVRVMQNGRTDNCVTNVQPTYILADQLKYEHNRALIFQAGNEYRRFETVSTRHIGLNIDHFEYFAPYYHATLFEDKLRNYTYSYNYDHNGHYLVRYDDATDDSIEADYFFVHFALSHDSSFSFGVVLLGGSFSFSLFTLFT